MIHSLENIIKETLLFQIKNLENAEITVSDSEN